MENEQPNPKVQNQSCRRLSFSVCAPQSIDSSRTEHVSSIHSNIRDELLPVVGMEFDSEKDAHEFYNKYAKEVGFSTRKSKCHKDREGKLLDRTFCCSAEGTRGADKRDDNVKCHRPETRFNCKAMIQISGKFGDKLRVTKFIAEHSHCLASPRKSVFFRSQRTIEIGQAVELEALDQSGIAPRMGVEYMARKVGGVNNLGFLQEDYRNHLRSRRTEIVKVGDTGGVLEYLQKMQFEDPNFFYALQVDVEDLITNILWVDSRMKLDYECFGDVVCFDTTYRKNKEGRPFAMFVGVNHHKQSVIFGAALLYDETTETFMWLFDSFVNAMSSKKPETILTDEDAAMAKALALQWPETHHRLCLWHIYQNAAKHLSSVFENFTTFAKDFSSCVYDHDEEEEFMNAWHMLLEKYNLQDNVWLQKRFELREKWALVYGRQSFCADMSTTQRSESMNNQIKQYIGYNYDIRRFFAHFQRLLDDIRFKELKADFKALTTRPYLPSYVEIWKGAANVYTLAVFKLFPREL